LTQGPWGLLVNPFYILIQLIETNPYLEKLEEFEGALKSDEVMEK
jgi:hypothetical protein